MFGNSNNSPFNEFSFDKGSFGTQEFMDSNSLVAKFAFLLLVIFMFVVLLRAGISFMTWFFAANQSPVLIKGLIAGNQTTTIPQDPSSNGAITIYRSQNASDGIEFSWSVWIYVEDLQPLGQFKNIFYKGNDNLATNGMNFPNNAPGLYLAPNTNALVVMMNTFNVINEEITIPDIPMNKWFNVIIRCQNTTLDVYINGVITRSIQLHGVPKQNYGDVYVAANGGFDGYISTLQYYNYSLSISQINKMLKKGPDTTTNSSSNLYNNNQDYLSLRWYLFGANNMYNP